MEQEKRDVKQLFVCCGIVGESPQLLRVLDMVRDVVRTDTSVLILGESGTGKELLAQAIHYNSRRAEKEFVAINCAGFPESLLESELFGYEKGAFTGASITKMGLFELAEGGTLFLDEIGDMSLQLQAKLLRVLEEKKFMRLGGVTSLKTNVRIISATNKDLMQLVSQGRFREDLYYRINVFPVVLPPLRERKKDTPLLVEHFIQKFNIQVGKQIKSISKKAMDCLYNYEWVGNIRELQNVIEWAVIVSREDIITERDLPAHVVRGIRKEKAVLLDSAFTIPTEGVRLEEVEKTVILQALERCGHNKTKAAKFLGLSRAKFRYRLKKFHIE